MSAFDQAFTIVIGEEGDYTDDAADPGGATKYGISHAAYPDLDIANLTLDDAKAIYKRDYWDKISGDLLDPRLALIVFDAAVNNGISRAGMWLQQALGVPVDGVVGSQTIAATSSCDVPATCAECLARRLHFMTGLVTWSTFGMGWSRRICGLPWKTQGMTP